MDQVDEISVIRPENATNLTIGIKCDNSSDCYFRLKITNETRYIINVTTLNYTSDFTTLHDTTEKEFTLTTRITHVTSQLTTKISTFLTSLWSTSTKNNGNHIKFCFLTNILCFLFSILFFFVTY